MKLRDEQISYEKIGKLRFTESEQGADFSVISTSKLVHDHIGNENSEEKEEDNSAVYGARKTLLFTKDVSSGLMQYKHSKLYQKRRIKQNYAKTVRNNAKNAKRAERVKNAIQKIRETIIKHKKEFLIVSAVILLVLILFVFLMSCTSILLGGFSAVSGTTYTSDDTAMYGAEEDYTLLEVFLKGEIDGIESKYPSYDEYRYDIDDISHDPYQLLSILTAIYGNYTEADVKNTISYIFEEQYTLKLTPECETRYRKEKRTKTYTDENGETHTKRYTVTVPYQYEILNISLKNRDLSDVAKSILNHKQYSMYEIYMVTKGNRPDLFK